MVKKLLYCIILSIFLIATGCSNNDKENQIEITISAAASLRDALAEIQEKFERDQGIKLLFNFGSSGALQKQIEQGAPVDYFISASVDKFQALVEQGLMVDNATQPLLGNELVLITPVDSSFHSLSFIDLIDDNVTSISIGIPQSVPAGFYSKEVLENIGIWSNVQSKIIQSKDVRQVLSYVETGNVDAGIVYYSDAITSNKIKIVDTADSNLHSPILYKMGVVKTTKFTKETQTFATFLTSPYAKEVFKKYGFKMVE